MKEIIGNIKPHGGVLVNRTLKGELLRYYLSEVDNLPKLVISNKSISDLELISNGAYSPLEGFMKEKDYKQVLESMHLSDGLPWTIPITLPITRKQGEKIGIGDQIVLCDEDNRACGIIFIEEMYEYDQREEARKVYGTEDETHPGVKNLLEQGEINIAGPVYLINRSNNRFTEHHFDPIDTREMFENLGWKTVVGFQTRNPVHRAHEYLHKIVLETIDGLLLNPLVGETKSDDIPADIRMESYLVLLENYYPKDRVRLAIFPAAMRYAGPREAVFHAIVRKNYGCTHFIVGRDHAGVGDFYGTYDAQRIFDNFDKSSLGIEPIFFEHSFYCNKCENMATSRTCPHDKKEHLVLSGTMVRKILRDGYSLPKNFTRPEVAEVLTKIKIKEEG